MGCNGDLMEIPSGYVKIAIGNGQVEIVDFPMNSMVMFHSFLYVYQRVYWFMVLAQTSANIPTILIMIMLAANQ